MIRAYDKEYLDDAMSCLGEAMDYASQACGMDMDGFLELFIVSGLADQFAVGVPRARLRHVGNRAGHGSAQQSLGGMHVSCAANRL